MINLFITVYKDKNPIRQAELDLCVNKNLHNKYLNTVLLENQDRVNFNYFFNIANKYCASDDINIVANSDIYFDETVLLSQKIKFDEVWLLSRWDVQRNGTSRHFNRSDSQDSWIWRGKIKNVNGNFTLGHRGIDNRIAHEFKQAGYKISNPSLSIHTHHLHMSEVRNYDQSPAFLIPPPYEMVKPTVLK